VVAAIEEVKIREDDYNLIKELVFKVIDLPSPEKIAKRERRVLIHGFLLETPSPNDSKVDTSSYESLNRRLTMFFLGG
jgi:hypothetical protein